VVVGTVVVVDGVVVLDFCDLEAPLLPFPAVPAKARPVRRPDPRMSAVTVADRARRFMFTTFLLSRRSARDKRWG
jgi:hypothetical protein